MVYAAKVCTFVWNIKMMPYIFLYNIKLLYPKIIFFIIGSFVMPYFAVMGIHFGRKKLHELSYYIII